MFTAACAIYRLFSSLIYLYRISCADIAAAAVPVVVIVAAAAAAMAVGDTRSSYRNVNSRFVVRFFSLNLPENSRHLF